MAIRRSSLRAPYAAGLRHAGRPQAVAIADRGREDGCEMWMRSDASLALPVSPAAVFELAQRVAHYPSCAWRSERKQALKRLKVAWHPEGRSRGRGEGARHIVLEVRLVARP